MNLPQVPADVYKEEIDGVKTKFMKKYGDHELEEMINQGDGPLDPTQIPMFNMAMTKQRKAVELKKNEKDKALAERVAQATLDEMLSHIESDAQRIREHVKTIATTRWSHENAEKAYQEQRYRKGLSRVEEHMQECVAIECTPPAHFQRFCKDAAHCYEKTPDSRPIHADALIVHTPCIHSQYPR